MVPARSFTRTYTFELTSLTCTTTPRPYFVTTACLELSIIFPLNDEQNRVALWPLIIRLISRSDNRDEVTKADQAGHKSQRLLHIAFDDYGIARVQHHRLVNSFSVQ